MTEVAFRKAGREDVALSLEFIRELADYEKMLDEVVATPELLEKWIFAEWVDDSAKMLYNSRKWMFPKRRFVKVFSEYEVFWST